MDYNRQNDLTRIIEYIAADSPANAKKILKTIKSKSSELQQSPKRRRVLPELKEQGITQYNEIIIPPWRLIYRIASDSVYIVSIIDSKRNVEDMLLERFIG
jgi:plasmid stabilization system protein ParE